MVCGTSPPQAKSPSVQHQGWIVELKPMAMPPQGDEAILECAALTKMQQALCATYPVPPPSPDPYIGEAWEDFVDNIDTEDHQPEPLVAKIKWYDSDEGSYSSCCPKDKNILAGGPHQFDWREKSSIILKVTKKVYHIGRCSKFE